MTLNPQNRGFSVLLRFSAAVHTSKVNARRWLERDQDNQRTGTAKAVTRFVSFAQITWQLMELLTVWNILGTVCVISDCDL